VADYRALKWSKLALNVVANASCAILDMTPQQLVREDEVFAWEIRAMREVKAVMKACNIPTIDLPRYPVRALHRIASLPTPVSRGLLGPRIAEARGEKPPSLLLDLRAARHRTEVDVLNGAVVRAGREAGVPTPINACLARLVNDIAHMPQTWAKYRERPEALVAEIKAEVNRRRVKGVLPA
jgi:2-dehydropantoate 2-reductase